MITRQDQRARGAVRRPLHPPLVLVGLLETSRRLQRPVVPVAGESRVVVDELGVGLPVLDYLVDAYPRAPLT